LGHKSGHSGDLSASELDAKVGISTSKVSKFLSSFNVFTRSLLPILAPLLDMADQQPPTVVEGATTGDVDDEIPVAAKSAEDRKAAAALSTLDAPRDDESKPAKDVDQEAVRKAMDRLAGTGGTVGTHVKRDDEKKAVKKVVKVDPADVTLLVCL
jgi:hypothetical protein